ncbi:REP-associated tyrosine transposase [Thalassotalea sp. ND16A]|uniref:REP-associated tyrosine transposase n=1 Tax=Thalassotalea sp. ND16A TaxID=1535422 RepID=UPI00051A1EA6|nr:transposase [Thalassotalea sp. ND16A]KGJ93613.1 hypothetical protein ND16A_1457 [Thalassotalea sp. ND16A]
MPTQDLSKNRISSENQIYHLVATTHKRMPVFDNFLAARIIINEMKALNEQNILSSLAWVVMPDHLHWLIQLNGNHQLSQIMKKLKGSSASKINKTLKQKGKLWQQGFYEHAIRHDESLKRTARYIVANPLRAKLVTSVTHYPHWDAIWL